MAGVTSNYTYDPIYQLTQVTQGANTTESYSYDAVGNRTASLGVSSYTTNASNELTATPNATYTYDNNGDTLPRTDSTGTTSYTWDFENRLMSVTLPGSGGTVTFNTIPLAEECMSLGRHPENYAAPIYRPSRARSLRKLDAPFRRFFECLESAIRPQ